VRETHISPSFVVSKPHTRPHTHTHPPHAWRETKVPLQTEKPWRGLVFSFVLRYDKLDPAGGPSVTTQCLRGRGNKWCAASSVDQSEQFSMYAIGINKNSCGANRISWPRSSTSSLAMLRKSVDSSKLWVRTPFPCLASVLN
jgi:hypothetical protein